MPTRVLFLFSKFTRTHSELSTILLFYWFSGKVIDIQEPDEITTGYYFNKTSAGEMLFVTEAHLLVYLHHPVLI